MSRFLLVTAAGLLVSCGDDVGSTDAVVPDAPVADAALADAPVADTAVADAPVADAPVTDAPVADAPAADASLPDAAVVDAGPDAGGCVGHTCPGTSPTLALPEGGELRIELFHTGYDTSGNRQESLGGWFISFSGQLPAARPVLGPQVTSISYPGGFAYCFDESAGDAFHSGAATLAQAIADTRSYYDVGAQVSIAGPASAFVLPRQSNAADPSTQIVHNMLYVTDPTGSASLERGAAYALDPVLPLGSFPGLNLRAGVDLATVTTNWPDPPAVYVPADFTLTSPTEAQFFAAGGLQIDSTADLQFTWTAPSLPAGWPAQLHFTAFYDPGFAMQYFCVVPDTGILVIPSGLFALPGFPAQGTIVHGALTHMGWNQHVSSSEEYRFDMVGMVSKINGYVLVTP